MIGLFVLGILGLWLLFAIWAAGKLSQYFWHNANTQPIATVGRPLTTLILSVLVILLPFCDQLIAYPKWQQLCATTSDFEWGPGMDEKKAFGRELVSFMNVHDITIFPNIYATYYSSMYKDKASGEVVIVLPHFSYNHAEGIFYISSGSGDKRAIFFAFLRPI